MQPVTFQLTHDDLTALARHTMWHSLPLRSFILMPMIGWALGSLGFMIARSPVTPAWPFLLSAVVGPLLIAWAFHARAPRFARRMEGSGNYKGTWTVQLTGDNLQVTRGPESHTHPRSDVRSIRTTKAHLFLHLASSRTITIPRRVLDAERTSTLQGLGPAV